MNYVSKLSDNQLFEISIYIWDKIINNNFVLIDFDICKNEENISTTARLIKKNKLKLNLDTGDGFRIKLIFTDYKISVDLGEYKEKEGIKYCSKMRKTYIKHMKKIFPDYDGENTICEIIQNKK